MRNATPGTRKAGTRTPRTTVTIQLTKDDRDLLVWLQSLESGTRQRTIKDALRAYKDGHAPAQPSAELDQALDTLGSWFTELQTHIDNQFASTRETLANITVVGSAGETPDQSVDATPRMTADELAAREARMKKSKKW